VLIATVLFVIGAAATYFWGGNRTQLDALVESSIPARMATAFIAVFTAPLIEELIYRGVLYSALQRAVGTAITVGIVSLLFAGVHVFQYIDNLAVIAVITLLSFTLTLVRAQTGSVLAPFVIHLVFNAIQSVIIALSPFTGWGQST
jgi:membrane protease YdiL (CAAX protease family)